MKVFLKAEWRKLAMVNYAVDPEILEKYLPYNTEIDLWNETCYVSLVGFMFLETRVLGLKVPFHCNFEEVNLRFYVRYKDNGIWKRGVVFIKEIVPRAALTFVANTIYKEHYETMPMSHSWSCDKGSLEVSYKWKKDIWHSINILAEDRALPIAAGSEEEFITEHYWGYTKLSDCFTSEYEVAHPRWDVYPVKTYSLDVDFGKIYGNDFEFLNKTKPRSVFLAEGSEILVMKGKELLETKFSRPVPRSRF